MQNFYIPNGTFFARLPDERRIRVELTDVKLTHYNHEYDNSITIGGYLAAPLTIEISPKKAREQWEQSG